MAVEEGALRAYVGAALTAQGASAENVLGENGFRAFLESSVQATFEFFEADFEAGKPP